MQSKPMICYWVRKSHNVWNICIENALQLHSIITRDPNLTSIGVKFERCELDSSCFRACIPTETGNVVMSIDCSTADECWFSTGTCVEYAQKYCIETAIVEAEGFKENFTDEHRFHSSNELIEEILRISRKNSIMNE